MSFFKRKMIERGLLPPEPDEQDHHPKDLQDQTKDQKSDESTSKTSTAQQYERPPPQQESFCKRKMRVIFLNGIYIRW